MFSLSLFAQIQIKKSDIYSTANVHQTGSVKILQTTGEVFNKEISQNTKHLSEGFINPDIQFITDVSYTNVANIIINLFPNPAKRYVNIKFSNPDNYKIFVFDMKGKKLIDKESYQKTIEQLNIENLSAGEYLVVVQNIKTRITKTFKINKLEN
jgi:hypothetical protein